jgi:GAF domain-containing protein
MAAADVPADLKGLQDALVNTENVEQFLHEMAVLAAQVVGSDSSCAMTMGHGPRPATVACTDPVAAKVDAVQYELDTGPCLHAMRAGQVVHIEDTAGKAHWPEFERRAASLGIQSCLALPLPLGSKGPRIGALNLYARHARPSARPRRCAPGISPRTPPGRWLSPSGWPRMPPSLTSCARLWPRGP